MLKIFCSNTDACLGEREITEVLVICIIFHRVRVNFHHYRVAACIIPLDKKLNKSMVASKFPLKSFLRADEISEFQDECET